MGFQHRSRRGGRRGGTGGLANCSHGGCAIVTARQLLRSPLQHQLARRVIVAGDSDDIPLAQRARRLGRTVIGIGVEGSTSAAFKNAVDEFSYYGDLADTSAEPVIEPVVAAPTAIEPTVDPRKVARSALVRALKVSQAADDGWVNASHLKQQLKRLDTSFDENKIGFKSFTDFLKSEKSLVELHEDGLVRRVRLRDLG